MLEYKIFLVGTDAFSQCESPVTIRGSDSIQSSIADSKSLRFNSPVTLPLPEDVLLTLSEMVPGKVCRITVVLSTRVL